MEEQKSWFLAVVAFAAFVACVALIASIAFVANELRPTRLGRS